jgi:hypothetical protein
MVMLCLFSFITGMASCSAFSASIKTAALNYPDARGTATAFPLAAFGLSALFFAVIALALPHDTYSFLMLLAVGTFIMPILAFPFLNVTPPNTYAALSQGSGSRRKSTADESSALNSPVTSSFRETSPPPYLTSNVRDSPFYDDEEASAEDLNRSKHSEQLVRESLEHSALDVRGWPLVYYSQFWIIFALLGILTGIGLMTINNIGIVTLALWRHSDRDVSKNFITRTQSMHVSILSFCSFSGRLISGIGSDWLVKRFGASRFWCLVASSCLMCIAQYTSISLEDPHLLILISSVTGLGYGMLFGVQPSIVANTFGVQGLSQNWGVMTLAPVISGNVFNILYGRIYDSHSVVEENGDRQCELGRECYESAYVITLFAGLGAVVLSCYAVWKEWKDKRRRRLSSSSSIGRRHDA